MKQLILSFFVINLLFSCTQMSETTTENPLPSWNEGAAKNSIIEFVTETTDPNSKAFISPEDRIAVFDNDGTLWSEQPYYFQLAFAIDRVKAMVDDHPEWKTEQPFKALLEGDIQTALSGGEEALLEIVMATHAGMTTKEFEHIVKDWIHTARHPQTGKLFKEMVYQPMLEVLVYLRENGFKTFIVSGGGVDFMRPWTKEVYGIPPDQVVGSSGKVKFEIVEGRVQLIKLPEINFIDDKEEKPVGIHQFIGTQPVLAFGNSDGDLAMMQYTAANDKKSLLVYIHHTDAEREYAYGRNSHIGRLDKGMDEAIKNNWTIVDMKNDWKVIYP